MGNLISISLGILPVLFFLVSLWLLDGFKLVRPSAVRNALLMGLVGALLGLVVNDSIIPVVPWGIDFYSRYIAPPIEEGLKALFLGYLIRRNRVGFVIDAAILGFAVGAGFAVVENLYYFYSIPQGTPFLFLIRGFGTAVMHGSVSAIFAMVAKVRTEKRERAGLVDFLPGWILAVLAHSLFNHFFLPPLLTAMTVVIGSSSLMGFVFSRSEASVRAWLGSGLDSDAALLEMITSGNIAENRVGRYLLSLQERMPREVLADLLCLLRIYCELSIKAKGVILMREAGFTPPHDPTLAQTFEELRYLESSVGRTGRLTIAPLLRWGRKELWQLSMLMLAQE